MSCFRLEAPLCFRLDATAEALVLVAPILVHSRGTPSAFRPLILVTSSVAVPSVNLQAGPLLGKSACVSIVSNWGVGIVQRTQPCLKAIVQHERSIPSAHVLPTINTWFRCTGVRTQR